MPNLKIHVDGLPHEDGVVYLKLIEVEPNHIQVAAVNQSGEPILDDARWEMGSVLLTLTESGHIAPSPMVFPEFGFDLGSSGQIKNYPYGEAKLAQHGPRPSIAVDNTVMTHTKIPRVDGDSK